MRGVLQPAAPSHIAGPYPALARPRTEAPDFFPGPHKAWIVTSYAECLAPLRDDEACGVTPDG